MYRKDDLYLHYVNDVAHKFEAWVFSDSSDDLMGEIVNEDNNECADATGATWEVLQVQYLSILTRHVTSMTQAGQ